MRWHNTSSSNNASISGLVARGPVTHSHHALLQSSLKETPHAALSALLLLLTLCRYEPDIAPSRTFWTFIAPKLLSLENISDTDSSVTVDADTHNADSHTTFDYRPFDYRFFGYLDNANLDVTQPMGVIQRVGYLLYSIFLLTVLAYKLT